MLRAYLVDDEPLALKRLARLLKDTGRVEIAGSTTDPVEALAWLSTHEIDVAFLDIQMPSMTGLELLARLERQPLTVFTTAYDQYALDAFEHNSVDYLLKPIEPPRLIKALDKIERMRRGTEPRPDFSRVLDQVTAALQTATPTRLASRTGERLEFVDLSQVTHFYAQDKLTYAATGSKNYPVDFTIVELEKKLDPRKWVRIHRSSMINLDCIQEIYGWFAGRLLVRLKDGKRTELSVARDRVKVLKERLGI